MSRWEWEVTGYYKTGGKAFITTHATEHSKDMEVSAAKSRDDIGRVEVRDLRLSTRPDY
jgi:hypothetical protein